MVIFVSIQKYSLIEVYIMISHLPPIWLLDLTPEYEISNSLKMYQMVMIKLLAKFFKQIDLVHTYKNKINF